MKYSSQINNKTTLKWIVLLILAIAFPLTCINKTDFLYFLEWFTFIIVIGVCSLPLTASLFKNCKNFLFFSTILGFLIPGFIVWGLGVVFNIPFNRFCCIVVFIVYAIVNGFLYYKTKSKRNDVDYSININHIVIFYFVFLFWTYLIGFNPSAYGTERFMDYGFMQKMLVSTKLPPDDLWYAGESINYYYGGQFYAAFIAKTIGTTAEYGYNLMRALIPGLVFTEVFVVAKQMLKDRELSLKIQNIFACLSAMLTVFAGNMHYVVYGLIKPLYDIESDFYWFPDATRYIGFNPSVENDQTIHEFPSYSFILGDLHAHMINIMFVLLLIAVLYSFIKKRKEDGEINIKQAITYPHLYIAGLIWGIYNWTNYWDYIIYIVVIAITLLAANIISEKKVRIVIINTFVQLFIIAAIGIVAALPFTMNFMSIFKGVGLATQRSRLYQLAVLWGLPVIVSVLFIIFFLISWKKKKLKNLDVSDIFCFILSCCAIGLIAIPEFVYVRDIYEGSAPRANTMFKLTYEGYIMFALCSGYILGLFITSKKIIVKVISGVLICLHILTIGYFDTACGSWFYGGTDPEIRYGLSALKYLDEKEFADEKDGIMWLLNEVESGNIDGDTVIAEAPGLSYTAYERVSVITGLTTVGGWQTHEWLWRDSYDDIQARWNDVDAIYNGDSNAEKIIKKYNIKYIFVGLREEERYGEACLNNVTNLGETIYDDETVTIIKIEE